MTNTSETQRLYYGFTAEPTETADISKDKWDNYIITVGNCTELRECCRAVAEAENANADRVETSLASLFEWLDSFDHEEVGSVEEEGWYEPPHYSWADPAAACDADGEITSATVKMTYRFEDTYGGIYHNIDEAIDLMYGDEVIDDEQEILLKSLRNRIALWVADKIYDFEGDDVISEV